MRFLAALLLVTACNASDRDDRACTEIGCGSSGAQFALGAFAVADVTPSTTSAAEFDVCLNGHCSTVVLGELPASGASLEIRGAVVVPNVTMSATFSAAANDMISVSVNVLGPDATPFNDGDVYRVKVTSTDGRVLSDRSWTVDYHLVYPNGPQCEPACAQVMTMTEAP
jgi:hypothetical protein